MRPAVKLSLLVLLSLLLLVLDKRFAAVAEAKKYLATALYPMQWVANRPVLLYRYFDSLFHSQNYLLTENQRLTAENTRLRLELGQHGVQLRELAELKTLADLRRYGLQTTATAQVVSGGKEHSSGRMVIDKGGRHGVRVGDAVVDEGGLLGQVAAVQPLSAEVNVLAESALVVPVLVGRTGVRTLVYGGGGALALRYFPADADLRAGDVLLTSGLDDVYPAGIPVATVASGSRNAGTPYYKVRLNTAAAPQRSKFVLVLPQQAAAATGGESP
nr:rod shape-determining protein MreC [Conchiformibius kuhniae]